LTDTWTVTLKLELAHSLNAHTIVVDCIVEHRESGGRSTYT